MLGRSCKIVSDILHIPPLTPLNFTGGGQSKSAKFSQASTHNAASPRSDIVEYFHLH